MKRTTMAAKRRQQARGRGKEGRGGAALPSFIADRDSLPTCTNLVPHSAPLSDFPVHSSASVKAISRSRATKAVLHTTSSAPLETTRTPLRCYLGGVDSQCQKDHEWKGGE
eukprot:TRINITY_DN12210_c0_g1_i1.p1 TRINITY_DN12210_c0_g1~~TRINITY_DN12210_c0_g1_i1.p1  ORF type:complete len:111 (-),score=16.83 TRINITY_DN12210_c0_g1_i1:107-439(-)